jgi:hypothetical protein
MLFARTIKIVPLGADDMEQGIATGRRALVCSQIAIEVFKL